MIRGLDKLKDEGTRVGFFFFFSIYSNKTTVLEETRVVFSQEGIVIGQEAQDITCFRGTFSGY